MVTATDKEEKDISRIYEVGYLLSADIAEEKVAEETGKIRTIIEKEGGLPISDEFPKLRQLAYTLIKRLGGKNLKVTSAYFGWYKFELSSDFIGKIKSELEKLSSIVRFLLIKTARENTMYVPRPVYRRPELMHKKEPTKPAHEVTHTTGMTDAELDKTIADLVVE